MAENNAACVFCRIANGAEPNSTLFEDEQHIVFLDKRPVFLGHSLVVPKPHHETLYDLPAEAIGPLFKLAQKIGKSVERGMGAEGSFIAINNIVSQSVPHLHIHIIPRIKGDGLRGFFWPRQQYMSNEQLLEIQEKIKKFIEE